MDLKRILTIIALFIHNIVNISKLSKYIHVVSPTFARQTIARRQPAVYMLKVDTIYYYLKNVDGIFKLFMSII